MTEAQTLINEASPPSITPKRLKSLQKLGVLCGFAAGAWLGAAEAPTKLVSIGVSPLVISFMMVLGVFLARWSVPALLQGMSQVREDVRKAPHLMLWGILAGCLRASGGEPCEHPLAPETSLAAMRVHSSERETLPAPS